MKKILLDCCKRLNSTSKNVLKTNHGFHHVVQLPFSFNIWFCESLHLFLFMQPKSVGL